jgi:hypothetical protein
MIIIKNFNLIFRFQSFSYNMLMGNNNILIYSTNCLSLCNFDKKENCNFIWAQGKFTLTIVDSQFNDAIISENFKTLVNQKLENLESERNQHL